jgi:two-component system sensor histidine kinase QseC
VILMVWLGVGRGLAPLGRLAREVSGRDPRSLDEIPTATVPSEVLPLVQALNRLFQRLGSAFLAQRRFTADAAHELRTPLAGVKTQAQVAMRAPDPAERQRALEQVLKGIARAGHLVEQLLVLARIDRESTDIAFAHPDLHKIAVSVLSELSPQALARGVDLELDGDRGVPVRGSPDLLSILLRNLVDNAVRHTPPNGRVLVRVTREQVGALLTVQDNGPGIPPEQRERVFARFYRLDCAAGEGSGLGLSIVQRISALHGATISLQDGPGGAGLAVEVRFPEPRIVPVKVPAATAAN